MDRQTDQHVQKQYALSFSKGGKKKIKSRKLNTFLVADKRQESSTHSKLAIRKSVMHFSFFHHSMW